MSIVIINPNSTETMTDAMVQVAQSTLPDLAFDGWTSHDGPPSIQGAEDGEIATPPLLELVRKANAQGAEGIIIGCFDDTALREAAALAACPVIGIGQAAYHFAALRNWQFSVVTTMQVSVPVLEQNIHGYGVSQYLSRVRASNAAVLDLENDTEASAMKILKEAQIAQVEDNIDALILGCAGMVQVHQAVQQALSIPVIDPIICAASCFGWLTKMNPETNN